jgi:hypothetical protein
MDKKTLTCLMAALVYSAENHSTMVAVETAERLIQAVEKREHDRVYGTQERHETLKVA